MQGETVKKQEHKEVIKVMTMVFVKVAHRVVMSLTHHVQLGARDTRQGVSIMPFSAQLPVHC